MLSHILFKGARVSAGQCIGYGKGVLNQKVTYHTFPKDENRIEKWIKHLHSSVENGSSAYSLLKFSDYTVISSDHFEENCFSFSVTGNTKILKKSAVPTLFKKVAVIQANEQINMPNKRILMMHNGNASTQPIHSSINSTQDAGLTIFDLVNRVAPINHVVKQGIKIIAPTTVSINVEDWCIPTDIPPTAVTSVETMEQSLNVVSSLENEVTAKASSSKKIYRKQNGSPFYGNKLQRYQYVMKKLRKMASSLQKSVNKITTLVGEENIELLKEDPRMRKCITCVRKIIEQEGNKNCDANAKSSFLFIR
ncbi:uncharacterized protein LOC116934368 [Daphnia magna]|nr:uncharacterized protein LOC116934368 [Daphnia magna]